MAEISNALLDDLEIEDMMKVVSDVLNDVSIENSKLNYTPDLRAYRKIAEQEYAELPSGVIAELPNV